MNKIIEKAIAKKAAGYQYMAAIVKSHYNSSYYNVQLIDDIIANGKWIACQRGIHGYRQGTIGTQIDWSITCRK